MPHHDLVIIGTGSGNTLITPELEGLDIAIVESGVFGGTCVNVGCIPTKMLVVPADVILEARMAERLGVGFGDPDVNWPAIRDRVFANRLDPIAVAGEEYRRSQDFVTYYPARARFTGERTLRLSTGEQLTADQVVVAAGARPATLPVDGLREPDPEHGLHTSDTVMRLDALPPRMIVIGGGFVACEMSNIFATYGVDVTQVQRSDVLLRKEERSVSERYTELARKRYTVHTDSAVTAARRTPEGVWQVEVSGEVGRQVLDAEVVLLAVGRIPNGDQLDAPAGGMQLTADGRIAVDDQQRTTAPGTWALGDVSSPWELKHVANHEARTVAHNLAIAFGRATGEPATSDHRFVPHAVFGHPQVASFGPTSAQLDAAGVDHVSATQLFRDVAFGWALEDCDGFLTLHATPTGQLLAAHCIGPHSATLIQPLIQAASFGQHAREVATGQYWIHPALAEVVENALLGLPL